jgi:hypothetical protein
MERNIDKMTVVRRTKDPAAGVSPYDKTLWEIPYKDTETFTDKFFPVFGGPKGAFKLIERADMPKSRFGRQKATDKGADVTRPTTETTPTYVKFLQSIGAIP